MTKNSKQAPATPLSETEIEVLDTFLSELSGPIRSLEGLDGLVCALTCAPTQVDYDEYMAAVLGGDAFTDDKEAGAIEKLAKQHQQSVKAGLDDTLTTETLYTPALLVDEEGKAQGNQWALGFLLGVSMTEDDWADFTKGDEMARLLLPMMVLAHEHHPDPQMRPSPIPEEGRDEILYMMANSLALIYGHFNGKPIAPN
ncbi:MAG: UPF0149 family protein [Burkholderiaceae bacterium]|nr:UPF0149 family protein [Burkholderiaceae bacterium]MCD8538009.1 UPF0149 family protein [Burkholderiaceae bacterium]MCD8564200.1 UPF0149 family protein [Burkholderiaceae bacterium]